MSRVLAKDQNLSDMLFYQNAVDIRNELTKWLLKDFGMNRKTKRIKANIKGMSEEDAKTIDEIIDKYDVNNDRYYITTYPSWFAESEKVYLLEIMRDIMSNIIKANSIYVTEIFEYEERRNYSTSAISDCFRLQQELDYITTLFPSDLNYLITILDKLEKEIKLLRNWRKSIKRPKEKTTDEKTS